MSEVSRLIARLADRDRSFDQSDANALATYFDRLQAELNDLKKVQSGGYNHPPFSLDSRMDDFFRISGQKLFLLDENLFTDGWIPALENWVYASASSITIVGVDVTAKYRHGVKIKLTQATTKYFYVSSSSFGSGNTTVNFVASTDYTVANTTIADNYYSYATPADFPSWMNYQPVWASGGTQPTIGNGVLTGRFVIRESSVLDIIHLVFGSTTSGGTGNWKFRLATNCANPGAFGHYGIVHVRDLATNNYDRFGQIDPASDVNNIIYFDQLDSGTNVSNLAYNAPFTFGDGDSVNIQIEYEME